MPYIQKRKEYYFKDLLSISLKGICLVVHQYAVGRHIVDFYIPDYQIIVEYDEAHHSKESSRLGDSDRERELMKILPGINLIRVTVDHEVEGLNQVLKYIPGIHDASAP